MSGIVVHDLGGGDHAWSIVDGLLWAQVSGICAEDKPEWREWISWLASTNDGDRPTGCPDRAGCVEREFYTQEGVIEEHSFSGKFTGVLVI
jgi:hypothetical protein